MRKGYNFTISFWEDDNVAVVKVNGRITLETAKYIADSLQELPDYSKDLSILVDCREAVFVRKITNVKPFFKYISLKYPHLIDARVSCLSQEPQQVVMAMAYKDLMGPRGHFIKICSTEEMALRWLGIIHKERHIKEFINTKAKTLISTSQFVAS